ncbi:Protein HOTHEAD, partial [Linum perenne]
APNFSFVQEATAAPPLTFFDYIIVGGGTAGCPLAATLSQHAAVLVLERGGSPYNNTNITDVSNFVSTISDTSPDSPSQIFVSEDGVYNTRARVLGGGSAIGAGYYSHAEPRYVRRAGWDEELVRRSYEWVEWKVGFEPQVKQWQSAVREALVEIGVQPNNGFTYAHDYGTKIGGTIFDEMGRRHSAADLLEYARPRNIRVYLHATVIKILFKVRRWPRPIAYGVIYEDALGVRKKAILKPHPHNEVILAAGAIGSPQLMMLSGIGPGLHLRSHGIQVVVDNPNVGKGMADNPMNLLYVPSPVPVDISLIQVAGIPYHQNSYIETASGLSFDYSWAQGFANDYVSFFNKVLQVYTGKPSSLTAETIARAIETVHAYANTSLNMGGVILQKVRGPLSSGDLKLRSTSLYENPSVSFDYYKHPRDLEGCVEGMRSIVRLINSPSFEQFCKDTVMTNWDYHGGCQVGRVVDPEYRVLGVDGLRVIDGSTFLRSPGTNPQATVMMLGR